MGLAGERASEFGILVFILTSGSLAVVFLLKRLSEVQFNLIHLGHGLEIWKRFIQIAELSYLNQILST